MAASVVTPSIAIPVKAYQWNVGPGSASTITAANGNIANGQVNVPILSPIIGSLAIGGLGVGGSNLGAALGGLGISGLGAGGVATNTGTSSSGSANGSSDAVALIDVTFHRSMKPEGITTFSRGGKKQILIVDDAGGFAVLESRTEWW